MPNTLLGRLLDGGRASAYAAHLLAIKAGRGSGYSLQEGHVGHRYGIGRRGFRQGIARLRDVGAITAVRSAAGLLRRPQPRRRWAAEAMTELVAGERWTPLPEALVSEDSFVVAMVLTVLLSPEPVSPADAAARFGVSSPSTVARLAREAVATGAVSVARTRRGGAILALGRPPRCGEGARAEAPPATGRRARSVSAGKASSHREMADATVTGSEKKPPTPTALRRGGGSELDFFGLVEALRREGLPRHAVDLLERLADGGLLPWLDPDPLALARRLCQDLAGASPRATASVAHELRARQLAYWGERGRPARLPPPWLVTSAVRDADTSLRQAGEPADHEAYP